MVDPKQVGKKSGNYEQWTKEHSDTLLGLMVEAAVRGWRDNSGILCKTTVEERILPVINEKLGCHKTFKNYQSRLRWFKSRWTSYSTLMRFSSGFGYDPSTKRFIATDEAHPNDTDLRYGTYEDYEDLEIAIGNGVVVGKNSIGLGSDVTDARTLVVEEGIEVCIGDLDYDIENEAFVSPNEDNPSALRHLPFNPLKI
ncbi:hypothetical protein ACLB2K_007784 [Fragaria x ananassa]